ncbi:hypothetical protein [Halopiger aswanensis]|uniref:AbrB family transcriptional regulator n=1 Tax=Halopiger aswanensis TaxID=148449 RepID=A0A419WGW1_9EURY|nr:hypothetical protein [Halopiger aswanensis]RKD94754.1 hypothetical protein ATJ93_1596 [Halopiger aswanensis]
MSGIDGFYADSRKVTQGDGTLLVVVPAPIVDEFDLEAGDDLPFMLEEGGEKATILNPNRDDSTEVSISLP